MKTYLITTDDLRFVKIGKANNIHSRLIGLQCSVPFTLGVLGFFEGDIEKDLHDKYADYNVRGEWFDYQKIKTSLLSLNYTEYICDRIKLFSAPFITLPMYEFYPFKEDTTEGNNFDRRNFACTCIEHALPYYFKTGN